MSDKNDAQKDPMEESGATTPGDEAVDEKAKLKTADTVSDELPDEEELTPELIEEEAIRGDFMLRWAAILLTVLFAFGLIADTRVLVHIRSGEFLLKNGFLPYQPDGLSYAAPSKPLANTSWLFDIVVSQVYAIGGATGLTIFQAVIAAVIAFILSRISVRMMPTWWNSVCCVLAAAAFSIDLLPITDIVTVLGLAITLKWLHQSMEEDSPGLLWKLPLLLAIWCNLDPRAYLGSFAVTLFAIGTFARGKEEDAVPGKNVTRLPKPGLMILLSFLALFVNPFPIASALSVFTTYSVETPGFREMKKVDTEALPILDGRSEYFQIFSSAVWHSFEFAYLAGVCLLVMALIVLALNAKRQDLPWTITLSGFFLLTLVAVRELPAAALVAAVVAGTSAQRWYGRTFRQEYSVETAEVMFSRGGRAATVIVMGLLAFCVVADRLPTRTAIGFGWEPQLKETMSSLSVQLEDIPKDHHLLNTKLEQGDILIWDGRESFVDSRVRLFGRRSALGSMMNTFEQIRLNLLERPDPPAPKPGELPPPPDPFENDQWKRLYDQYEIRQVMIRLSPPGAPAYIMLSQFMQSPKWLLLDRGASAALFRYTDRATSEPPFSTRDIAFVQDRTLTEKDLAAEGRGEYAQPPTFYQKYLYLERPTASAALRDALHAQVIDFAPLELVAQAAIQSEDDPNRDQKQLFLGRALGGPIVAIRRANQALRDNPNDADAFQILASAYGQLFQIEQTIAQYGNGQGLTNLRYFQVITATHQALRIRPDDENLLLDLATLYSQRQRKDLSLQYLSQLLELKADAIELGEDSNLQFEQLFEQEAQYTKEVQNVREELQNVDESQLSEDPRELAIQHFGVVNNLNNRGFPAEALKYYAEKEALLQPLAVARVLRGQMLLEAGELEEGFQLLNGAAKVAQDPQYAAEYESVSWQFPVAASQVAQGAYSSALEILEARRDLVGDELPPPVLSELLRTLPLVPAVETRVGQKVSTWPSMHLNSMQIPLGAFPASRALPMLQMAVLNLEVGRIEDARKHFRQMISECGSTVYRPLAEAYLVHFGEESKQFVTESAMDPLVEFEFPDGTPSDDDSEGESDKAADEDSPNEDSPNEDSSDKAANVDSPNEEEQATEKPESDSEKDDSQSKTEAEQKPSQKGEDAKSETGVDPVQGAGAADNSK